MDNDLGPRAFYVTLAEGLHDLGSLVDGGLAANGWEQLATGFRVGGKHQILGSGLLTTQTGGQMPYLLTQIPEPSTAVILFLATVLFSLRRPNGRSARQALIWP
jgi:hypothetical protein